MPFWNPKKYNPLAQQMGMGLMQSGMNSPNRMMSPYMGLSAALKSVVGGLMARGQRKAEKKERSSITEAMMGYRGMERKKEEMVPFARTMAEGITGEKLPEGQEIFSESKEEFATRQGEARENLIKKMMDSPVEEYKNIGTQMFLKSLETPDYSLEQIGNKLYRIDKQRGTSELLVDESGPLDGAAELEKGKWYMGKDGELFQPMPDSGRDWEKGTVTNDAGNLMKWDNNLNDGEGGFVDTGQKAQKPASLVKLEQEINLSPEEEAKVLTPAMKTNIQKQAQANSVSLMNATKVYDQGLAMTDEEIDNVFTYPGKIKMAAYELKEKLGLDLTDDQIKQISSAAGFKATVWMSVNKYIHEITGAQVSAHEVNRLMNAIANPNDSYHVFMAKLRSTIQLSIDANDSYQRALMGEGVTAAEARAAADAAFNSGASYYLNMDDDNWNEYGLNAQRVARANRVANTGNTKNAPPNEIELEGNYSGGP